MEWDEKFMRFYTDSRIHTMLDLQTTGKKGGFWDRAGYVVLPLPSSNVPNENPRTGSRKQRKTGAEKLWSIILTLGRESLLRSIRVLAFSLAVFPSTY